MHQRTIAGIDLFGGAGGLTYGLRKAGINIVAGACAGSGKTEVVARRVVHLLSPGKGGTSMATSPRWSAT